MLFKPLHKSLPPRRTPKRNIRPTLVTIAQENTSIWRFWGPHVLTFLAAVIVSLSATYFQFFAEVERFEAFITQYRPESLQGFADADTLTVTIAFANKGNQKAIIKHMDVRFFINGSPDGPQGIPLQNPGLWPRIVNPGDIILVTMTAAVDFRSEYNMLPRYIDPRDSTLNSRYVYAGFLWVAVNSNGQEFKNFLVAGRLYFGSKEFESQRTTYWIGSYDFPPSEPFDLYTQWPRFKAQNYF